MTKRNKIIYWIFTVWLALGMLSSAIVQLLKVKAETDFIINMGYPVYFLTIIGIWKILGVITVLIPKIPFTKGMGLCRFLFCYVRSSIFAYRIG